MEGASKESRERFSQRGITQHLFQAFSAIDVNKDNVLDNQDLTKYLISMDYKPQKGEVADMLWEIDENRDGVVNWSEFQSAYHRCTNDKKGNEPRQLYNVILFALHAGEGSKLLSRDAAAKLLYFDCGRDELEQEFLATFGSSDTSHGGWYTLKEFIQCMKKRHIKKLPERRKARRGLSSVKT